MTMKEKHTHEYSVAEKKHARKECCNYVNSSCLGNHACWVAQNLNCPYYNKVVDKLRS